MRGDADIHTAVNVHDKFVHMVHRPGACAWVSGGVGAESCTSPDEVPTQSAWRLVRHHAGLRISSRLHGSEYHTRLEAVIPYPAAEILAIMREFDLAHTWNTHVCVGCQSTQNQVNFARD